MFYKEMIYEENQSRLEMNFAAPRYLQDNKFIYKSRIGIVAPGK